VKYFSVRKLGCVGASAALLLGCPSPRRPPELPPPEYERPVVAPWPPGAGDPTQPSGGETAPAAGGSEAPKNGVEPKGPPVEAPPAGSGSDNLLDPAPQVPESGPE